MKIATIAYRGERLLAVVDDSGIRELTPAFDKSTASKEAWMTYGGDLTALLREFPDAITHARPGRLLDADEIVWLPPVMPGKICCVAINNRSFDKDRISGPDHPAFFLKSPTSLIGHEQTIELREAYGLTHPEPELAIVIGRKSKDLTRSTAMDAVFGYTILNDVTSIRMRNEDYFHFRFDVPDGGGGYRAIEQHTSYAGRYKGADTFGPIGPVIVTSDEISDPDSLRIECRLDGEVVQSDSTASYRYSVAEVVSFVSQYETLLAGDVISMGTAVSNTGKAPRPLSSLDLRAGVESVSITIDGIGTLRSDVRTP
jgi:2-keto-4-pentenoate hydratase/2-oxohepta-3-ene-1,7-dioic acid hydratase in catechol pathway